jgi:hypothetical protein
MPRGGARVGAGRKPNAAKQNVVDARARFSDAPASGLPALGAAPPVPADAATLLEPPPGVSEPEAIAWRALAPHAIAQQTLVAATRVGFRELVEQLVMKQTIADSIAKVGADHPGVDGLLRHYAKLAQRLDATLARFRLTGSGKPEAAAARKAPASPSPWAMAGTK